MKTDFDICIVGSGAGASPVAATLADAGYSVVVLEKGPWYTEQDFFKDEMAASLRSTYTPDLRDEPQVVETENDDGSWHAKNTYQSGWDFWNGNCVGGSSNFMSGFFHRLKPMDFRLRSEFGMIADADVMDWPISYEDLEPYYTKVEHVVGVSGRVVQRPYAEPRSTKSFPYPATQEHPIASHIDSACSKLGVTAFPLPRAILPYDDKNRQGCSYSGYCGAYGCATGAKGSSRAALLNNAVATGRCTIYANTLVSRLLSDNTGQVIAAECINSKNKNYQITAKIFVVACQAIETSRLLLLSTGPRFPNGLANSSGLVGQRLLFAGGGVASGQLVYKNLNKNNAAAIKQFGTFVNRAIQDWYVIDDPEYSPRMKGGTLDFVHLHPNPTVRAMRQIRGRNGLIWGNPLKEKLKAHFKEGKFVKIEAFCDWLPIKDCYIELDPDVKDKWGRPVARIRVGFHHHNLKVGWYLAARGAEVLQQMGAENIVNLAVGSPPTNLQAGGCRFGKNPKTSVLDPNCRAHDVENLYVTDGSFMPTGGSVPPTWTIYANAFRVADKIIEQLE